MTGAIPWAIFSRCCFLLTFVGMLLAGGCSGEPAETYVPDRGRGAIDESLPADQRVKQDALARLFEAFRSGLHTEDLERSEPDLVFQEPEAKFFQEAARVWSWDWDGAPKDSHFPVRLTMQKDEPGVVTVDYSRVYEVERRGSKFIIRRVLK